MDSVAFRPLGDSAVTIDLFLDGAAVDSETATTRVARATEALRGAGRTGALPGLVEVVRAPRSVTVHFDPLAGGGPAFRERLAKVLAEAPEETNRVERVWRLPACYDATLAPDLEEAARTLELSPTEIIRLHQETPFRVHMIGFLPGFPFMGDLPERLRLPRRAEPRTRVPAGSIAMAERMTAIYPWESPGGWTLIGHCPVPLFSATWERPALLMAGDRIHFAPISREESEAMTRDYAAGHLDPQALLEDGA